MKSEPRNPASHSLVLPAPSLKTPIASSLSSPSGSFRCEMTKKSLNVHVTPASWDSESIIFHILFFKIYSCGDLSAVVLWRGLGGGVNQALIGCLLFPARQVKAETKMYAMRGSKGKRKLSSMKTPLGSAQHKAQTTQLYKSNLI